MAVGNSMTFHGILFRVADPLQAGHLCTNVYRKEDMAATRSWLPVRTVCTSLNVYVAQQDLTEGLLSAVFWTVQIGGIWKNKNKKQNKSPRQARRYLTHHLMPSDASLSMTVFRHIRILSHSLYLEDWYLVLRLRVIYKNRQ